MIRKKIIAVSTGIIMFSSLSVVLAQGIEKSSTSVKPAAPAQIETADIGSLSRVNEGARLLAAGETGEAEVVLGQAVVDNPESPEAMYNFGLALGFNGKFAESVRAHLKAIELKEQFPEAHLALGNLYLSASENENALLAYEQAHQIAHNDALRRSALFNRATALIRLNRLEEAELALSECLVLDPLETSPVISLANLHEKKGNHEVALGWLESAGPEYRLEAAFLKCRILIKNGNAEKAGAALIEARKALEEEKGLSDSHRSELAKTIETMAKEISQLK